VTGSHCPAGDGRPVSPVDAVDADAAGRPDGVDVDSVGNVGDDDVPEIIHAYTRRQALADGVLVDVSRQASPAEMHGGFVVPVAVTAAVWSAIHAIPPSLEGIADVRGRLHDVLWLANVTARRAFSASRASRAGVSEVFAVLLPVAGSRRRKHVLRVEVGPDDDGAPCVTIGYPEDF
jgi:hypothetical protein